MKKYSGFQKLDDNISKIIKPISKKKRENFVILQNLTKNWPEIAGQKYYQYCYPKKIKFNQNNTAILFIGAYNSAIAFALEGNKNYIIEKIASYFGYKIVTDIKILQELKEIKLQKVKKSRKLDDKEEKFIKNNTLKIKDQELQSVLKKLGELILSQKTN